MIRLAAALLIIVLAACSSGGSAAPSTGPSAPSASRSARPLSIPPVPTALPSASPTPAPSPSLSADGIREFRSPLTRLTAGDVGSPNARAVSAADRVLALRLYAALATTSGNLIFSPYSISTALSMVAGGARGATAAQLAATLGIGSDQVRWHGGRNDLDQSLQAAGVAEGFTPRRIEPTNALFGQDGFPFATAYLDLLASEYGAGLQTVDFANRLDVSRAAINRWVAARTNDRIRELLPPSSIDEFTRFVLVNAIFFKASWATPFEPGATTSTAFHLTDGTSVRTPTMHGAAEGSYVRGDGWQAVEIPYVGATMTVVMPDAGTFAAVEQKLDAAFFSALADHRSDDLVHLALPRWTSTSSLDLIPTLKALGIRDLFEPGVADLRAMADADLAVSAVIHQATITVDEKGTEAAAATAIAGGTTGGGPTREISLNVDRPFVYFIRDDDSGEILFAGRVLDPTQR